MTALSVTPYLTLSGRCDEALAYYQQRLGATVEMVMRFRESPDPAPPGMLQEGFADKIMHSSFRIGQALIMATDGCDDKSNIDGVTLALTFSTPAEVQQTFAALADGGSVTMAPTQTFWSPCFAMVTDRFGVAWMLMVPGEAPPTSSH